MSKFCSFLFYFNCVLFVQKQLTDKLIEMWNMELKVKEMEGQNDRLLTELHAEKQGKEEAEGKGSANTSSLCGCSRESNANCFTILTNSCSHKGEKLAPVNA